MTKFHESEDAKTHELTLSEQSRLTETRTKLNQSVLASTEEVINKTASLNDIEKAFIHGKATAADVEKAQLESDSANAKLTSNQRLLSLADTALKEIDLKIAKSQAQVKNARYTFCMAEHGRILAEINADQELQKKLVECFAAYRANGWRYSDDWQTFMDSLTFVKPNQAMIDEAVEKFHQTHKLDRQ